MDVDTLLTQGDRNRWEKQWSVSGRSAGALFDAVNAALIKPGKWSWQPVPAGAASLTSAWTFRDESGGLWNATAAVGTLAGQLGTLKLTMIVSRAGSGGG